MSLVAGGGIVNDTRGVERSISIIDPDEQALVRERVSDDEIRSAVVIDVHCLYGKGRQIGSKGDPADSLEPDMHFDSEVISVANEDRAVGIGVVVEIGSDDRWAEQPAGKAAGRTHLLDSRAQSILRVEGSSYDNRCEKRERPDQRAQIQHPFVSGLSSVKF